jgi:hypothetical protein
MTRGGTVTDEPQWTLRIAYLHRLSPDWPERADGCSFCGDPAAYSVERPEEVKRFCFRCAAQLADRLREALAVQDAGYSLSPKGFAAWERETGGLKRRELPSARERKVENVVPRDNGKPLLRRAMRLVDSGKGNAEVLGYDELSEHEGELPEYEYRFEVYMVTTERFAWGLGEDGT